MTWRGPRTANDPMLSSPAWRKLRAELKAEWARWDLPCARCGKAIAYDGPRYLITWNGRRTVNPRGLVIGHKVSRNTARRMGWTEAQMNTRSNLRPECNSCSAKSGAREGNQMQRRTHQRRLDTSRRW